MTWNVGDLARMKSGGPIMTVGKTAGDQIQCRWFAGENIKTAMFKAEELVPQDEVKAINVTFVKPGEKS